MFRTIFKRHRLVALFPFAFVNDNDKVEHNAIKEDPSVEETGVDRVKQIFLTDDFGRLSSEARSILQVSCMSAFFGCIYGGFIFSREAYLDFIKRNQATTFNSHLDAKRKLQDAVTLGFAKGAFKWSWRLGVFTTLYMTTCTTLAAYRGKNGILEHAIAGGVAGTLYKLKLGPSGWAVGGGLGLTLGGIAGIFTYSLLKMSGMTMEEVRYWNYRWVEKRSEAYNKQFKSQVESEEMKLLVEHAAKYENISGTLLNSENK